MTKLLRGTLVKEKVLISDENTPPLQEKHGLTVKTFLGSDDLVCFANVKTYSEILCRSIHKLCLSPVLKN